MLHARSRYVPLYLSGKMIVRNLKKVTLPKIYVVQATMNIFILIEIIMTNISYLNNDTIVLNKKKSYVFIDAVYVTTIKHKLEFTDSLDNIRNHIFPYTDTPFAEYDPTEDDFNIHTRLVQLDDDDDILPDNNSFFSTDTGMIIAIEKSQLLQFVELFDYEDLVESAYDIINLDYWNKVAAKFESEDLGLLLSSETSYEILAGGGYYKII